MPRGQKIGNRRLRMPWLFSRRLLTGSLFANDILCLFVSPQAEEHGLTELASLVHSVNLTWATSTGSAHSQRFMTAGVTPWPQRPGLLSGKLTRPPATGTPSCSECPCFFAPVGGLWRICNSSREPQKILAASEFSCGRIDFRTELVRSICLILKGGAQ